MIKKTCMSLKRMKDSFLRLKVIRSKSYPLYENFQSLKTYVLFLGYPDPDFGVPRYHISPSLR